MYASVDQLRVYLPQVLVTAETTAALTEVLTRSSGVVRDAMRECLADPLFDYAAFGAAATKIVRGYHTRYLVIPAHQAASVTLVEYMTGMNPATYAAIADEWLEESGRLYRAFGWTNERYRITAVWGYGNTIPASIEEIALELAVSIWRTKDKGGFTEIVGVQGSGAIRMVAGLNEQQRGVLASVCSQLMQELI